MARCLLAARQLPNQLLGALANISRNVMLLQLNPQLDKRYRA
jgi:hypothetical protein